MDLIIGDVHWSRISSILNKMGETYSKRLEHLINSVNWAEELADTKQVDRVIYLGDFFDKNTLSAMEISALKEVVWSNAEHIFLTGNHEMLSNDLSLSSAMLFSLIPKARVINKITTEIIDGIEYAYIPYQLSSNIVPLSQILPTKSDKPTIVFSHNDLKINYGGFESTIGFEISDIEDNCDMFFNGHLHNGSRFCKNGINVGSLCGMNFSEDAFRYPHNVILFDYNEHILDYVENPYGYNFYKLDLISRNDLFNINFKNNAVLSLKVIESEVSDIKSWLANNNHISDYRLTTVIENDTIEKHEETLIDLKSDYLNEFVSYIKNNLDMDSVVLDELGEVTR